MTWIVVAASVAALLALAGVVLLLRRGRDTRIESPEDAANAVDATLSGFRTTGAVIGSDGAVALMVDAGDRVAVCRRRGARLVVDEVTWNALRATGDGLLIEIDARRSQVVTVTGVTALDVRRLRGQDERSRASASAM